MLTRLVTAKIEHHSDTYDIAMLGHAASQPHKHFGSPRLAIPGLVVGASYVFVPLRQGHEQKPDTLGHLNTYLSPTLSPDLAEDLWNVVARILNWVLL